MHTPGASIISNVWNVRTLHITTFGYTPTPSQYCHKKLSTIFFPASQKIVCNILVLCLFPLWSFTIFKTLQDKVHGYFRRHWLVRLVAVKGLLEPKNTSINKGRRFLPNQVRGNWPYQLRRTMGGKDFQTKYFYPPSTTHGICLG